MFASIFNALDSFTLGDFVDILLLTVILYSIYRLIKDTKAYQMALGLGIVGLLFLITQWGNLYITHRLIQNFITYLIIAVIVLFQVEIRKFLTTIGSRSFRKPISGKFLQEKLKDVFLAVDHLSSKKIGALIAFEKEISLNSYAARGSKIDGTLSKDLLASIFFPNSPLHDGAVIMRGNKILSAGCLLPLPAVHKLGEAFITRTRHLAATGLSQETDAAVIVVSEETGTISLATGGNLDSSLDKDTLKEKIIDYFEKEKSSFKDYLLKNKWLKLFSFLTAFILWITLIPEAKTFSERTLTIPLELHNIPSNVELVERPPFNVDVKIRAPKRLINTISSATVYAVLNLERASVEQSEYSLNRDMVIIPEGAEVKEIYPSQVHLLFELLKEIMLDVEPNLIGEMKEGLKLIKTEIVPSQVLVRGPESKVKETYKVRTRPILKSTLTKSVEIEAYLLVPDPSLRLANPDAKVILKILIQEETSKNEASDKKKVPEKKKPHD